MIDVNSGYIGYSMSRRAAEAYEDGEMPKSKWTKKAMVAAIQSYCDEFDMLFDPDLLKGMHKDEVFERFFHESSWHHTARLRCDRTGQFRQGNRVSPVAQHARNAR